jgi:hypothetical protein
MAINWRSQPSDVIAELTAGGDYDTVKQPDLTPYLNWGSKLTDRVATCSIRKNVPLDADELKIIEILLAAHAYKSSDQALSSKSTLSASGSFQGRTGNKLEGTKYGQKALIFDTSGCVENIDKRQVVHLDWVGKTASEQLTWDQRNL